MTSDSDRQPMGRRVSRRRLMLARAALFWELFWPAMWPAVGVVGVFLVTALFDLWPMLSGWLHLAGLVGFFGLFLYLVYRGWRTVVVPGIDQARRRIELSSGLDHRPLQALEDSLATNPDDPATRVLWRVHRRRMSQAAARLRVGLPRAGLAERDPRGFRAAIGMLLVIGGVAAGSQWPERLAAAVVPDLTGPPPTPAELDAWIVPPAYTGKAPIFLSQSQSQAQAAETVTGASIPVATAVLKVPAGSTLLARVHGGSGVPGIRLDQETKPFDAVDLQNFQIRVPLTQGERLAIVQDDKELGAWPLEVVSDTEPTIAFLKMPSQSERLAVRIDYRSADDYGLARVYARIRLDTAGDEMEMALTLPGIAPRQAADTSYHDLTAHPWAGLPVTIELVAEDALGQEGVSQEVDFVLPERQFTHPVARALIEQRKALALEPERRRPVMGVLRALALIPDQYGNDIVVHLTIRAAMARLRYDSREEAVGEVQEILWQAALRLEDGNLSLAERELREIQRQLAEALANGASDEEVERLMNQLQEALDRYLQAMVEQAQKSAQQGNAQPLDPNTQLLSRQDLQQMIDRARDLSRSGARDAARQMLNRLQEMLENMRAAMSRGMSPQQQQTQRKLQELSDLMTRQQRLLDRTFRSSRNARQGQQGQQSQQGRSSPRGQQSMRPGESPGELAGDQEALRRALGEIMRQLGEAAGSIPAPLGRAERAMRGARQELQEGRPGGAVRPQSEALDQLRQGARSMIQQMLEQMGQQGQGRRNQPQGQAGSAPQDPLGRPLPGSWQDGDSGVKIPDKPDTQRAREILQELHRRTRDRGRPVEERDYIDRLLKRF